jgi:hypothetical protein
MLVGPFQAGRVLMAIVLQSQKEIIDNMERNLVVTISDQRQTCVLSGVIAICQFLRATRVPSLVFFSAGVVACLCSSAFSAACSTAIGTWSSANWMNSPREFLRLLGVCVILKSDMSSEARSFIPNKCFLLQFTNKMIQLQQIMQY